MPSPVNVQRYGNPITVPLGPLNSGVQLHMGTKEIPEGAFLKLKNFYAYTNGIMRRHAFEAYSTGSAATGNFIDLFATTQANDDSTQQLFLVTATWVYKVTSSAFTQFDMIYSAGSCLIATGALTTVTGSDTVWQYRIKAGDTITVGANTRTVSAVGSDTVLTVTSAFPGAVATGTPYHIHRTVGTTEPYLADQIVMPDRVIVLSEQNEPWDVSYGDSAFGEFATAYSSLGKFRAACGAYWNDRVYVANLYDGTDATKRHRIRWSTVTDITDFSDDTAYQDMPYTNSPIMRMVPFSSLLMLMFRDKLFMGRPSNRGDLPILFQEMNTGGRGLLGQKAVVEAFDGLIFVGQDNIYYVDSQRFEAIGTPVIRETLRTCQKPWRIYATKDLVRGRALLGFPGSSDNIERIWSYDYQSRAWSSSEKSTWMIANPWAEEWTAWADVATNWEDEANAWSSFSQRDPRKAVFVEQAGLLVKWGLTDGTADSSGSAIEGTIESKDFDYKQPDDNKLWLRLGVKITESDTGVARTNSVVFNVWLSNNEGVSWISKGTLTIRSGRREGYINFRMSSSTIRFKLITDSVVPTYTIEEITMLVKGAGVERSLSRQNTTV